MSTLKATNLQNENSATVNISLNTSGGVAFPALTGLMKANGSSAAAAATAGTDYMAPGTSSNLTVGHTVTPYNLGTGSGTVTPAAANGNYQYITNNGAFTMAAPAADCAIDILVTNGASAGAITISGYTAPSGGGGDTYATTNANKYLFMIRRINGTSTYAWKALQ